MKPSYIYKIENILNGRVYIGFTQYIKDRKAAHKRNAIKLKSKSKLYNAIRKYGWSNFTFQIIYCSKNRNDCLAMEKEFIKIYNSIKYVYNIQEGGISPAVTKEIKTKLSQATSKQWSKQIGLVGWKLIYPDGKEIFIDNLRIFCKNNNLQEDNLYNVAKGKRKHHKGFKVEKVVKW